MATSPTDISVVNRLDHLVAAHARGVMPRALSPVERDDRFDTWPSGAGDAPGADRFLAALATSAGEPSGLITATTDRGRIQLDALIAQTVDQPDVLAGHMLAALTPGIDQLRVRDHADVMELWGKPARPWHGDVAAAGGMGELRALHQMRCSLPVDVEPVPNRPFRPDDPGDVDAVRSVNNRAFATHPDQGNQSLDDLRATMAEPWFRPEGLRLFERDGRVAGFCWTKIHPPRAGTEALGEIYVIGVDPDFHGQGLGVPMTAAGLSWLAGEGLGTGMLYVEADNVPAIRTYERLGFAVVRTDRAWARPLTGPFTWPFPGPTTGAGADEPAGTGKP